jgi:hypothetical protein
MITPAILRTTTTDEINSWQQAPGINVQTGTTYTITTNDYGQMVTFNNTGAVAVSLPAASGAGFFPFNTLLKNVGAAAVTITPTTSTIDGAASLTLTVGQSAMVISDGTNYRTAFLATAGGGGGGSGTVVAGTINQLAYYAAAGTTVSGETLLQAANMPALTGDVINTAGTVATTIAAAAVTNAKMANMAATTIKGNNTGSAAAPIDLTVAQVIALLAAASGGGTANFLRADGTWNTPGIPINNQSVAYTAVLADANTAITHPTTDNTARTFTIPANASVAYPVGTTLTFVNMINTLTIAITTDTMTLAGAGTTGSRTLAAAGIATALKLTSTTWLISGTGLT